MRLRAALIEGRAALAAAGIETAALDAELCLAAVLDCDRLSLLTAQDTELSGSQLARLDALITRRTHHEPMAYILGHREFHGLDFTVTPATLIPRPDSETLVETALARLADHAAPCAVLDLGTGSGCLLLSLLHHLPTAQGIGVDISADALKVAEANARRLGLADRTDWRRGDWWGALEKNDGPFDLIISNPPYIAGGEIETLAPDVRRHEPLAALDGGADGLVAYRRIVAGLTRQLRPGGIAVFEIGAGQASDVAAIFRAAGWSCEEPMRDLAGQPRVITVDAHEKGLENAREIVSVTPARRGTGCDRHRPDVPNPDD